MVSGILVNRTPHVKRIRHITHVTHLMVLTISWCCVTTESVIWWMLARSMSCGSGVEDGLGMKSQEKEYRQKKRRLRKERKNNKETRRRTKNSVKMTSSSSSCSFWESNLAGPNGYGLNSPPTVGSTCNRLLPIMGFNYERTYDLMMHSFGHRLESAMVQVYGGWQPDESTAWNRFSLLNKNMAGHAGCGNVSTIPVSRYIERE